jgi:hypothetical protein
MIHNPQKISIEFGEETATVTLGDESKVFITRTAGGKAYRAVRESTGTVIGYGAFTSIMGALHYLLTLEIDEL